MKANYRLLTVAVMITGLLLSGSVTLLDSHVHETPGEALHCDSCSSSTVEGDINVATNADDIREVDLGLCDIRPIPFETNVRIRRPRGPPLFLS